MPRTYHVVIQVDENGNLVSSVPELLGLHREARSVEQLRQRTEDAIPEYLEEAPSAPISRTHVRHASDLD